MSTGINRSKELILSLCEDAYPGLVSATQIKSEAKDRWPNDPRWTERETNHGELKFMHDINNARENLLSNELISNPKIGHYRLVTDIDSRGGLRIEDIWPEVLEQSYKFALSEEYCYSFDGNTRYQFSIHNKQPMIINNEGVPKQIGVTQVTRLIHNLNLCGGAAERPFKNKAELSAIVHCSNKLKFNSEGWVETSLANNQTINILTSLEKSEDHIFSLIEDIIRNEPKRRRSVKALVRESKQRSKGGISRRNQPIRDHTIDDPKWIQQKESLAACEVTGIPFTDDSGPFARSLDQRIPGAGYTKENVDLVIRIYNLAKSVFRPEDVERFCSEFYKNKLQR